MKTITKILLTSIVILIIPLSFTINVFADNKALSEYENYVDWDNQIVLTKYLGNEAVITVPSIVDGYVVKMTEGTFAGNDQIKRIVIPDGIVIIGDNTFNNCSNLRTIKLSDSVEFLGNYAFSRTSLVEIHLPKSTSYIGIGCFYGSENLKIVKANAKLLYIDHLAFYNSGIELMQLSAEPRYWGDSFSRECKFSYDSITTFLMRHEPLFSIFYLATNLPIVFRALYVVFLAILLASIILSLIYLLYRLFRRIRIVLGKDKLTLYNLYNKKCINCVDLSDNSVNLIYKKKSFRYDKVRSFCIMILIPVVYIFGFFIIIAFFALRLFNGLLKTVSFVWWILIDVLFCIALLILYVILTYLLLKLLVAIAEAISQKNLGRATRSSARIKKIRKD